MTPKMTMNVERDEAAEKREFTNVQTLYKPLPVEAGTKFTNELFLPLFQPDTWGLFNQTPEDAERLGMTTENPLVQADTPTLYTFFFKIPTHPVRDFIYPDGTTRFASVICPHAFNDYLVTNLGYKPLFNNPKCAFCEASKKAWVVHNERWKQVERERGISKKELEKEGYLRIRNEDARLKQTYDQATMFRLQDKYVTIPFDHGKLMGSRPRKEDETNEYQIWFAPRTIVDTLKETWRNSESYNQPPFFDFGNPNGLQILSVIKDTTKCSAQSLRDTKYSVMNGPVFPYDDNWKAYLTNLANMPDPTSVLTVLPYGEMKVYAEPQQEDYNSAPAAQAPAPTPQAAQAPAPQMTPPGQATPPAPVPAPQAAPPAPVPAPQAAPPAPVPAPQAAPPAPVPAPQATPPAPVPAPQATPPAPVPQMTPPPVVGPPGQAPAQAPAPVVPVVSTPTVPAPAFVPNEHAPVSDDDDDVPW